MNEGRCDEISFFRKQHFWTRYCSCSQTNRQLWQTHSLYFDGSSATTKCAKLHRLKLYSHEMRLHKRIGNFWSYSSVSNTNNCRNYTFVKMQFFVTPIAAIPFIFWCCCPLSLLKMLFSLLFLCWAALSEVSSDNSKPSIVPLLKLRSLSDRLDMLIMLMKKKTKRKTETKFAVEV